MPNKFVGHGPYHYAKGGEVRRELKFMEDKGAPKSMIAAEKKEHGLPAGKKFAVGGVTEGENKGIDEDTRERALAAVRARMQPPAETPPEDGAVTSPVREAPPAEVTQLPPVRRQAPPAAAKRREPPVSAAAYPTEGRRAPRPTPAIEPERAAAAEAIASAMSPERAKMVAAKRAAIQKAAQEEAQRAAIVDSMRKANATPAAAAPQARQQPYMPAAPSNNIPGMRQAPGMAAGGSIDGCASRGKTRARRG